MFNIIDTAITIALWVCYLMFAQEVLILVLSLSVKAWRRLFKGDDIKTRIKMNRRYSHNHKAVI